MTYRCCRHCINKIHRPGEGHHGDDLHGDACPGDHPDWTRCIAGSTPVGKPRIRIMLDEPDVGDWWWVFQEHGEKPVWLARVGEFTPAEILNWAAVVLEAA